MKLPIPICEDCGCPLDDDGTCPACRVPINLAAQQLQQTEPLEDTVTLVKCPYCSGHHQKFLIDLCPLNPYKP